MDKQVVAALLKMVREGTVVHSNISRQSISEVVVKSSGHSLVVSWYPPYGWGRGTIRSLSFDGMDTPLHDRDASVVMRAIQDLVEKEFSRRASSIISAADAL